MRTGQHRIGRRWYLLLSPRPVRITLSPFRRSSIVECRFSIFLVSILDFSRVASRVAFRNDDLARLSSLEAH
jgi:hypothetical protein